MNAAVPIKLVKKDSSKNQNDANAVIKDLITNELIFAVVGPAGSGTTWVADALESQISTLNKKIRYIALKQVMQFPIGRRPTAY